MYELSLKEDVHIFIIALREHVKKLAFIADACAKTLNPPPPSCKLT